MFVQTQETPNPNSLKFIPDKKSSPKNIPVTPLIESIFLIKSLLTSSLLLISNDPLLDTILPGINLSEFGFGVF